MTEPAKERGEGEKPEGREERAAVVFRPSWKLLGFFVGFCFLGAALTMIGTHPNVVPEAGVSLALPASVLGMPGKDFPPSEAEMSILPKDTEFAKKTYTDPWGNSVNCQIVLSGGDRRSIHRPEACLPGQGWNMLANQPFEVGLEGGKKLMVKKLRLSREVETSPGIRRTLLMLYLYWYVGSDYTTHDQIERVVRSNVDLLLYNLVHRWAYVIVSAPILEGFIPGGMNEEQTQERILEFMREAIPQFQKSEMPKERVEKAKQ